MLLLLPLPPPPPLLLLRLLSLLLFPCSLFMVAFFFMLFFVCVIFVRSLYKVPTRTHDTHTGAHTVWCEIISCTENEIELTAMDSRWKGTARITWCNNVALSILYAPGKCQPAHGSQCIERGRIFVILPLISSFSSFIHSHCSALSLFIACCTHHRVRFVFYCIISWNSDVMRSNQRSGAAAAAATRTHCKSHHIKSNEIFMTRILRWCFTV